MTLRPKPWNEIDVTTEVTDSTEILINNNGIKRISVENFNNNIENNITNSVLISISGSFVPSSGNIVIPSGYGLYMIDIDAEGAWRQTVDNGNLVDQRYENASWVTKNTVLSSGDISYVYASNDKTGATDYTNIQTAIQRQTMRPDSKSHGQVVLVGEHFYVNSGITIGNSGDNSVRSCNISSKTQSHVEYVGSQTSNYLLSVYGTTSSPTNRVSNLYLDCNNNCRGLLFHRQVYLAGVKGVVVYDAREVGVDWATSYKAKAEDLHILSTDGISLRVWHSQGSEFNNLRIASNAVTTWPSTTDQTVHDDYNGTWIQTQQDQQAAIMIRSQDLIFRNLLVENNNFIGSNKPLIYIYGGGSSNVHFLDQIYIENTDVDYSLITIDGSTLNTNAYGKNFTFQNIDNHDHNNLKTFIKTVGYIDNVVIDGILSPYAQSGDVTAITCFGSNSHLYSASVNGNAAGLSYNNLIVSVSGGTIEEGIPLGNNYQDIESIVKYSNNRIFVAPSYDSTGYTDSKNIQNALNSLVVTWNATDGYDWEAPQLVLDGHYHLASGIVVGSRTNQSNYHSISIVSPNGATLEYEGSDTSNYLISTYYNGGRYRLPLLQNLILACAGKCRGIQANYQPYKHIADNIYIYSSKEVGLDLIACWGSNINDVHIQSGRGIAIRATYFNATSIRNIRCQMYGQYHISGLTTQQSAEMLAYEIAHNRPDTIIAYSGIYNADTNPNGQYVDVWPSVDDTSVIDYNGSYVQTPEYGRATLVLHGGLVTADNIILERNKNGDYPLFYLSGNNGHISNVHSEENHLGNSLIITNNVNNLQLDGFSLGDNDESDGSGISYGYYGIKSFLEVHGNSKNIKIDNVKGYRIGECLIYAPSGVHYSMNNTNINLEYPNIEDHQYITSESGVIVSEYSIKDYIALLNPDLWLDSNYGINAQPGAPVTSWTSRDHNQYVFRQDASGNQPIYNRVDYRLGYEPAVNFDSNKFMQYNGQVLSGVSGALIIVGYVYSSTTSPSFYSQCNSGVRDQYLWVGVTTGEQPYFKEQAGTSANAVCTSSSFTGRQIFTYAANSGNIEIYKYNNIQGLSLVSGSNSGKWFNAASGVNCSIIGAMASGSAIAYTGKFDCSCILGFNRYLTYDEREKISKTLINLYNLESYA